MGIMEAFADRVLWKYVNSLYRKPNSRVRNRFLRDYRNASEESRNNRNIQTYYALTSFAKHNDADAIREIFRIGYPGRQDPNEVWTEVSLSGIAVENKSYEALQALADCGVDVCWYGGVSQRLNWAFVIAEKDVRMCRIIATAKNRYITDEAASFILEYCHDLVPELVKRANQTDLVIWRRVLDAIGDTQVIASLYNECELKTISPNDRVATLISILRYEDAAAQVQQDSSAFDAASLWNCVFSDSISDRYTYDFFYSDEVHRARSKLINTLFDNNLRPNEEIVKNLIWSTKEWWPQNETSYKNYLTTVTDLLARSVHSYDQALQEAMWWTRDTKLINHLILNGPSTLCTDGLGHMLVDHSLRGYWPEVISCPLGRVIRFNLWRNFCKEHDSCIHDVINILRCAHDRGVLNINEQQAENGETALHTLCKEAFPQALWMPCVQELITTLVEVGADLSIKDNCNKTVYDYAVVQRAPKMVLRMLCPDCRGR